MPITARFSADFSSFIQAIDKAEVALVDFGKGAGKVEASLNKMVDGFSGRKVIQEASLMTVAVEKAGGIATLTAKEIERVGHSANEAADKMRKLGYDVPAGMQNLIDKIHDASAATGGWLPLLHELGTSWVARIAQGELLRDAIHEIVAKIFEMAKALPEIALKGAAVADVEENFKHLTTQLGRTGDTLVGTLRSGTHNTITDFELMKIGAKDLTAGLNLTDKQFGTLAKGAFALAQATGTDVKSALDTMNDAMLTGRTRSLALLTGKIDVTAAEEKFAASLGKSKDNLTEAGKLEANRAAILDAVGAATARLGDQTDGLDERVAQANVAWENFKEDLGKTIATSKVLEVGMSDLKSALEQAFGGRQEALIQAIAKGVADVAIAVVGFASTGVKVVGFIGVEFNALKVVLGDVAQAFELLNLGAAKFERIKLNLSDPFKLNPEVDTKLKAINADIAAMSASIEDRGRAIAGSKAAEDAWVARGNKMAAALAAIKIKMQEARDGVGAFVGPLQDEANAHGTAGDAAGKHGDALFKLNGAQKKYAEALAEMASAGDGWRGTLATIDGTVVEAIKYYIDAGVSQNKLALAYGLTEIQVKAVDSAMKAAVKDGIEFNKRIEEFHKIGEQGAAAVTKSFAGMSVLKDLAIQMGDVQIAGKQFIGVMGLMPDLSLQAAQHMRNLTTTIGDGLIKVLEKVPGTIAKAFTGGGGLVGGLQAIGTEVATSVGGSIGKGIKSLGKLGGPIGEAIGSLAGPLIGFFANVFSGGAEHLINPIREAFVQLNGGLASLNEKAATAGVTLTQMLNAKNPEQYKTAIDALNAAFKFQDDAMKTLDATVSKYGFTIEDLGPKFSQQKLSEGFLQLYQDTKVLSAAGIDYDKIIQKQAASYEKLVLSAIATGATIPKELEPVLQRMVDLGLLTDASGNKLTDLGQLTFAETLDKKFLTLIDTINKLAEAISRGLGTAIANIPAPAPIHIPIFYEYRNGDGRAAYAAGGGFVTGHGVQYLARGGNVLRFPSRGSDTVPAMLTPGEGIVSRRGMQSLGKAGLASLNSGSGGNAQGGDMSGVEDRLDGLRADMMRQLPKMIRDAILLAPRSAA